MGKKIQKGKVVFIGAGPGDKGLITVKGKRALSQADTVLYDALINPDLLGFCKRGAEKIFVGKRAGKHSLDQQNINLLLIQKAEDGNVVARLKGGDPFLFGRGAEEAMALYHAKIPFQIIPGVPSPIAVPAYAGIPVTDRRYASSVAFVTGHEAQGKEGAHLQWSNIANGAETIIFLMGMGNLTLIAKKLITAGRSPETPAAVIHRGTTGGQVVIEGRLCNIDKLTLQKGIKPPGIIVIGNVVNLRKALKWFEQLPLFGKRIVITRDSRGSDILSEKLEENGAEIISMPAIAFAPPDSTRGIERAIFNLETYNWIIFTSSNGVSFFFDRLWSMGRDIRCTGKIHFAAIGAGTSQALGKYYIKADLIPQYYSAEGLVKSFAERKVSGARMLVPRAQQTRDILEKGLRALGNYVHPVPVYKTVKPRNSVMKERLKCLENADCVVFTSSSAVHNFFELMPAGRTRLQKMNIACIGPVTANALEQYGLRVSIMPKQYTFASLSDAIIKYYRRKA